MNKYKKLSIVANLLLIGSIILGSYALFNTYKVQKDLPPGVCPIENNRPLLYTAIVICLLSLAMSFYADRYAKK